MQESQVLFQITTWVSTNVVKEKERQALQIRIRRGGRPNFEA